MSSKDHWENVYTTKSAQSVSWFQEHADISLQLIRKLELTKNTDIIDVGGGASTLVDDLLLEHYSNLSVLDISGAALQVAKERLDSKAVHVQWIEGDITRVSLPKNHYDLWHDRAVFHFLTEAEDRERYVEQLLQSVKPGGQVIVATFSESGPQQCSNLPVVRYSPERLHKAFGPALALKEVHLETHTTPFETQQEFIYCRFIKL